MDGSRKLIVFVVAALVIGAAIGVAVGIVVKSSDKSNDDETYNFYLYFGNGNADNGWYSAKASNAGDGFKNAMEKAGFTYEISSYGYISKINGKTMDYSAEYLWSTYDKSAAAASIVNYGTFNGWRDCCGYDGGEFNAIKIAQSNSITFFIGCYDSSYNPTDISDPAIFTAWSTGEGTPFATA